jgi:hypothetical protein
VKTKYLLIGEFFSTTLAIVQNPIPSIKPAKGLLKVAMIVTRVEVKKGSNLINGRNTLVYKGINCAAKKIIGTVVINQYFALPTL